MCKRDSVVIEPRFYFGKKLGVVGASYLQLPVVRRANSLGLETICFAWEQGAVCRDFCTRFYPISVTQKEQILEVVLAEHLDGILTIASDVSVPSVCHVAQHTGLRANSCECGRVSTNKILMRKTLDAAGVRCPRHVHVQDTTEGFTLSEVMQYPLIVKPVDRSGSIGVTKVDSPNALATAIEDALHVSFARQAVVEEYIEGQEVSVEIISWEGTHHLLVVTDKETSGPPHFVELAHHQPSQLPASVQAEIKRQAFIGLDALGIEFGASHPEFIITPEGEVFATEIAARMGGDFIGSDLVRLSTGYDFLKGIIDIALGNFEPPEFSAATKCSGVLFYSEMTPDIVRCIEKGDSYPQCVRAEITCSELKPLTRSADRSGYFLYQSDKRFTV